MKRKFLCWQFCLLFVLITQSYAQGRKDIVVTIRNPQGGIVGKTLSSFVNEKAVPGRMVSNIRTEDQPSSDEQREEFNNSFSAGLSSILSANHVASVEVQSGRVRITSILTPTDSLPDGSKLVIAGYKADSVSITIKKSNKYNLSLSQLLDKISPYAKVSDASALNLLTLLDSVNYARNTNVTIKIKNPDVFYAITVARITKDWGASYFLDIPTVGLGNNTTLMANTTTEYINPYSSNKFIKHGTPLQFAFNVKQNSGRDLDLFIRVTKKEGGYDSVRAQRSGNYYTFDNILFDASIQDEITKRYYVNLRAALSPDGKSIVVQSGDITYAEWYYKVLSKKYYNK